MHQILKFKISSKNSPHRFQRIGIIPNFLILSLIFPNKKSKQKKNLYEILKSKISFEIFRRLTCKFKFEFFVKISLQNQKSNPHTSLCIKLILFIFNLLKIKSDKAKQDFQMKFIQISNFSISHPFSCTKLFFLSPAPNFYHPNN